MEGMGWQPLLRNQIIDREKVLDVRWSSAGCSSIGESPAFGRGAGTVFLVSGRSSTGSIAEFVRIIVVRDTGFGG